MELVETGPEQLLLATLGRGDRDAFWPLWQEHQEWIYGVCLRQMSGAHTDAADAASRTMLVAWEKLPRSACVIVNLQAWLTRLACNVCFDMHRERRRRTRVVEAFGTIDHQPGTRDVASPERDAISAEECRAILVAIAALPPALRDVAELRFLHEQSYETISTRLSLQPANARKRLQQAREMLGGMLGQTIKVRCTRRNGTTS
jgi:RNA polymerase sigma-70 factor (ECF subfamily)